MKVSLVFSLHVGECDEQVHGEMNLIDLIIFEESFIEANEKLNEKCLYFVKQNLVLFLKKIDFPH